MHQEYTARVELKMKNDELDLLRKQGEIMELRLKTIKQDYEIKRLVGQEEEHF